MICVVRFAVFMASFCLHVKAFYKDMLTVRYIYHSPSISIMYYVDYLLNLEKLPWTTETSKGSGVVQ
jgi:hypothetical protein